MTSAEKLLPKLVKDQLIYLVEHEKMNPKDTTPFLRVFYSDDIINQFFDNKHFEKIFKQAQKEFNTLIKNTCVELKRMK